MPSLKRERGARRNYSYVQPPKVDIGHPKNHQYSGKAKRHVVVKTESGWVLLCTGGQATREYLGFLRKNVVQCVACFTQATEIAQKGN